MTPIEDDETKRPGESAPQEPRPGAAPGPSPHRLVDPPTLPLASGFSHAVVAAPGRTVYVAGQTALGVDGTMPDGIVQQFDAAAANVLAALAAAGTRPEHLVSMQIFTTDLDDYLRHSRPIGEAYRRHFGAHYPAIALVEVKGLVGGAKIEILSAAVVPQ
jgi:enamine deaminase RidA (YjgF/YER057c/UK114 family)